MGGVFAAAFLTGFFFNSLERCAAPVLMRADRRLAGFFERDIGCMLTDAPFAVKPAKYGQFHVRYRTPGPKMLASRNAFELAHWPLRTRVL